MPSDLSPYFGNTILRWFNGDAAMPASPSALYMALFNGNPKTSGVEVGATINSTDKRQLLSFGALGAGATHILISDVAVDWGNAEAAATFSHVGFYDSDTAGNLYASKAVAGGPVSVLVNSSVKFNTGQVSLNIGSDT